MSYGVNGVEVYRIFPRNWRQEVSIDYVEKVQVLRVQQYLPPRYQTPISHQSTIVDRRTETPAPPTAGNSIMIGPIAVNEFSSIKVRVYAHYASGTPNWKVTVYEGEADEGLTVLIQDIYNANGYITLEAKPTADNIYIKVENTSNDGDIDNLIIRIALIP